jgi:hypothetical protein
MLAEELAAA